MKCDNKFHDRVLSNPRREFVRSKSIVSLVDESPPSQSTQGSSEKNWSQTYCKEYPKGYINKDLSHNRHAKENSKYSMGNNKNTNISIDNKLSAIVSCHINQSSDKQQDLQNLTQHKHQDILHHHQQKQQQVKRNSAAVVASLNNRLENITLGERRPSSLVRRYGNMYAQARLETLDALEELHEMRNATELKSKLVFSVVVVSGLSLGGW